MLALSFLLLMGLTLLVEAFDVHIAKGYVYFAMGFSVFVEMLNLRLRKKSEPISLHERYIADVALANHKKRRSLVLIGKFASVFDARQQPIVVG
jgi:predicted tellurium resistance membrane protein TerC